MGDKVRFMKQSVNIYILKASDRLKPFVKEIEHTIDFATKRTSEKIPVRNVDIVVYDDPFGVIPGFAHGARTISPHIVRISLNPEFPNFRNVFGKELWYTISHELHHTARWATTEIGKTLLDAFIFEGLASRFEEEVWGGGPPPWATALSGNKMSKILLLGRKEYANTKYDYQKWFFGKGKFPNWAGYSIGYFLVSEYIKKHPTQTAATLVSKPSRTFV